MRLRILAAVAVLTSGLCLAAMAQDVPQDNRQGRRGMAMDFPGVGGQITAIEGSTVTLHTFRGETAKVNITSSTRLTRDRNPAKLGDFKVGDRVFVSGDQGKDGVWTANVLAQRSGEGPRAGVAQQNPEDNGKTYIFGVLANIDGTKLTIKKPDNSEQVIEVDDNTSFHNERRESVTLAEIKVGDFVRGPGAMKNGVFVAKVLNAGRPRANPQTAAPPTAVPSNAVPNNAAPQNPPQSGPTQSAPKQ